ncbi:MAG: dihydrolipoyl dehydrogenase [Planctomycetota bacterium]
MDERSVQTLVIGAGPGGYVAAIRAAQMGRKVTVVERGELGGVCLNVGCIPSKALIHAGTLFDQMQHAAAFGITAENVRIDLNKLIDWKQTVVERLTGGVGSLLKANGVEVIKGEASFDSARGMTVKGEKGTERLLFEDCIVATGSAPIELPEFKVDGKRVLGSTEALALRKLPGHVVVLGGGYIGLEIGTYFRKLGSEVTVVELTGTLLPGIEPECVRVVARNLKKRKVTVLTDTRAVSMADGKTGVEVLVEGKKGPQTLHCDMVLSTVGRRPSARGLALERAGVELDRAGFVPVDQQQKTGVPGIYAIGDLAGQPMLAHKASHEGIVAAEVAAGMKSARDYKCVPAVVFTDPEIASVGLTEEQARDQGADIVVGKFPFAASGRALSLNATDGFSKLVAEKGSGLVLGAHIVGPEASELIAEMGLAIEMGATLEDIALTVHAHPTLPETIMEAAEAAMGKAIHIFQK